MTKYNRSDTWIGRQFPIKQLRYDTSKCSLLKAPRPRQLKLPLSTHEQRILDGLGRSFGTDGIGVLTVAAAWVQQAKVDLEGVKEAARTGTTTPYHQKRHQRPPASAPVALIEALGVIPGMTRPEAARACLLALKRRCEDTPPRSVAGCRLIGQATLARQWMAEARAKSGTRTASKLSSLRSSTRKALDEAQAKSDELYRKVGEMMENSRHSHSGYFISYEEAAASIRLDELRFDLNLHDQLLADGRPVSAIAPAFWPDLIGIPQKVCDRYFETKVLPPRWWTEVEARLQALREDLEPKYLSTEDLLEGLDDFEDGWDEIG